MNKGLYARLAWQNLRKNAKFYVPYLLTIIGTAAAFYILMALGDTQSLPQRIRYAYLTEFMVLGTGVIGIFAVIFLFYTNSFLMKRRTRELGLYHILGMGKRHLAKVLFFESLYIALAGILGGIVCGLLFQKLVTLALCQLVHFEIYYGFFVSWNAIRKTCLLFGVILLACLLWNLCRIRMQKSIELLHSEAVGEREPRTKWLLTLLGVATLGAGYYLAVTIDNAMDALVYYFVAVLLVIIGTYCLFTAISITVLKLLRANSRFYYQPKHFIGVSGMLYRMKRNAVGLANICILSTMVLVMVSGTLAMYLGTEDALDEMYPCDLQMVVQYRPTSENPFQPDIMRDLTLEALERGNYSVTEMQENLVFSMAACRKDGVFYLENQSGGEYVTLLFYPASFHAAQTGQPVTLGQEEVLVYDEQGVALPDQMEICFQTEANPEGDTRHFQIRGHLQEQPEVGTGTINPSDTYYVVVADAQILSALYEQQVLARDGASSDIRYQLSFNLEGTEAEKEACAQWLSNAETIFSGASAAGDWKAAGDWDVYWVDSRATAARESYSLNGGFFFLGMFLGLLFIVATVLIIYYKQISEGYEDAARYQIMQQVGLSRQEIRKVVNSQILVVFFLPLLVAAVHVAFDFKLIVLLLTLFSISNASLTMWCTLLTLGLFLCIYGVVYAMTARAYCRIVSRA